MTRLRRALRAFIDYVWDNPSAEQDARAILSAPKVGLWLGLEVLFIALGAALALFVLPSEVPEVRTAIVSVGTGPYLIFVTLGVVTLFLTLFVPLRAVGLLEGPRWRGYLDQVVTTGIGPLRYHAGKWATSQPFFLALLAASLPFVVLFGLLGGATVGRTALAYVLLYAYANLLLVVTMGLGVVFHEVVSLLSAWVLFGACIVVDLTPLPSSVACMTPVRFLIQPIIGALAGARAPVFDRLYGAAVPFGVEVPWPVWALTVWACLAAVSAVALTLGPVHPFTPGLNNFGTVVLPGDGGRGWFFRRVRPMTARRVELAFLFENRGPRLVRLTLPLRWLQQVVLGALVVVLLLSVPFDAELIRAMNHAEPVLVFIQLAVGFALLFLLFLLRTGWAQAMTRHAVGDLRVPVLWFDAAAFFVLAGVLIAVHATGFAVTWSDLSLLQGHVGWRQGEWDRPETPEHLFTVSSMLLNTQVVTAFVTFLAMRVVGGRVLNEEQTFGAGVIFLLALLFLPLLAAGAGAALVESDLTEHLPQLRPFAATTFVFGLISPITHGLVQLGGAPRNVPGLQDGWLVENAFWLWQAGLVATLLVYAASGHLALWREADLLDRLGDPGGAPPAEAAARCETCEGTLAVPAGWSGWGGVIATRLLGAVRCLDCRTVYLRKTGRPVGLLTGLSVMAVRALIALVAFVLLFGAVHLAVRA